MKFKSFYLIIAFLTLFPDLAYSYIGLAAFIPILGQAILFILVFILSVFGLFFYPLKKLFKKKMIKKKK